MNALRKLYKELTSLHWEIGFLDNTFEGIVRGDKLKLTLVTHNFPNSWFADPLEIFFVTSSTNTMIVSSVTSRINGSANQELGKL